MGSCDVSRGVGVRPSWSPLPHHRTGLGSLPASSKRRRISGPDADGDGSLWPLSVRKRTEGISRPLRNARLEVTAPSSRLEQCDQLHLGMDIESFEDRRQVVADGARAQEQFARDRWHTIASKQADENLPLPAR
jgi:hypothetical protein